MARIFLSIGLGLLLVFGLVIWLSPDPILAADGLPQEMGKELNSEGDEWVTVDPLQKEPKPPTPELVIQNENEQLPLEVPVAVLPGPEAALGVELDRARQAGPEAVLAFVASQPDPNLPLLVAATSDAQNELTTTQAPRTDSQITANWVALNSGPCAYATLQAAIDAAASGSTLLAAEGIFTESFDVNGKVLTIVGGYDANCTTPIQGAITEIHASVTGSVVDVTGGSNLTLRNLDLSGGTAFGAGVDVLGSSKVILDNTDVHDNSGASGGGLYIGAGSIITYTNDADIYHNTASAGGGGIIYGRLIGFQTNSDIYLNSSTTDGGGLSIYGGTVILDNADVVANTAIEEGGGIYLVNGTLELSNSVYVGETAPCCQSAVNGGGIYASGSQIRISSNSNVMNNTATNNGGGLYLVNGSLLTVTNGQVGNSVEADGGNDAVLGAGIFTDGSQVSFNGKIINNIATNSGGGIYATNSTITMTLTTVGGGQINEPNQIGATGLNGAGMYLFNNTNAWLDQTYLFHNAMSNNNTGYGGGIYIRQGSVLTMTNSTVEGHFLPSSFDGRGAGMYIYDATVTISNTRVASNIASGFAGGVRMFGTSVLNILDYSQFTQNQALNGVGGAIAATNQPDINIQNSNFRSNQSSSDGGAIYLDAGTVSIDGWFNLEENVAGGNGGVLAITGSGNAGYSATNGQAPRSISNNHAAGDGGAVYLGNNSSLELYATTGVNLIIQGNTADLDGGALFASAGGLFDIYGEVYLINNSAVGNGGSVYLDGGSKVWMDDYFSEPPYIYGNQATHGGAIYALNSSRVECDGVQFGGPGLGNSATAGSGGAIYIDTSTLSADNCFFQDNKALAGNGGAIAAIDSTVNVFATYPLLTQQVAISGRDTPVAPLATACNPSLQNCSRMLLNTASGDGGALYFNNSNVTVRSTIFDLNTANRGGAIYQEGISAVSEISNVLAVHNTSIAAFGAGIRASQGTITIRHTTLAHNTGGAGFSPGSVVANVYNTIIWGNSVAAYGSLEDKECNIDQGGTAGPAYDPHFLNTLGGPFRPMNGSPAIDACATGLSTDLVGNPRPYGTQYDMGAYEGLPSFFLPLALKK